VEVLLQNKQKKSMEHERANTYLCTAHLDFPGNETEKEYKLEKIA
jgi:hypothetical protein